MEGTLAPITGQLRAYLALSDNIKRAAAESKTWREQARELEDLIVDHLRRSNVHVISVNHGTEKLAIKERIVRTRLNNTQRKERFIAALRRGVTDPESLWSQLQEPGDSRLEWRLSRSKNRSKGAPTPPVAE